MVQQLLVDLWYVVVIVIAMSHMMASLSMGMRRENRGYMIVVWWALSVSSSVWYLSDPFLAWWGGLGV